MKGKLNEETWQFVPFLHATEFLNPSAKLLVEKPILCRIILLKILLSVVIKYWNFCTVDWQNRYTYAKWHCNLHHRVNTLIIEHHNKHSSNLHTQVYYMFFHIIHNLSMKQSHKILAGIPREIHHPYYIPVQLH